jgi:hypothetical protein
MHNVTEVISPFVGAGAPRLDYERSMRPIALTLESVFGRMNGRALLGIDSEELQLVSPLPGTRQLELWQHGGCST